MKSLELRVPPVAVTLVFAGLMWAAAALSPALRAALPAGWRYALAGFLAAAGAGISIAGVAAFRRASTTVNPMDPGASASLVTAGIYGWSRNPMYLGFLLVLCAWAMWLAHLTSPLFLLGFAMYLTRFQIVPEERILERRFGSAFNGYRRRVRRWL